MQTKNKLGFGVLATGLLLLPLGASAQTQTGSTQNIRGSQQVQGHADSDRYASPQTGSTAQRNNTAQTSADLARNAQGRANNINARFQETVGDNCQYSGTIRGTIREANVAGATADNATQMTPDLRIQATLSCPSGNVQQQQTVKATLRGPQYAREQLAQTIQERARIFTSRNGQVCSYAPRLAFDSGRLASNGIAQSCMTARGGGPGTFENQTSPLLRTPNAGSIDTQQQQQNQNDSMRMQGSSVAPNNGMQDNGMQQMPSTGGGPGLPGSDIQQGQPSIDDTMNRGTPQSDTTGTGRDIAPSNDVNNTTPSNPPLRQMK
jgi:hypothetical protein